MAETRCKAKDAKVLFVRLTPDQHESLALAAERKGLSLNTYALRRLGLDTPFEQGAIPVGRKAYIPLRVDISSVED